MGEIARVIGVERAIEDSVEILRGFLWSYECDVRMKALESAADLMKVVVSMGGVKVGRDMADEVGKVWKEHMFYGWRERECVQQRVVPWFRAVYNHSWVDRDTIALFRDLCLGRWCCERSRDCDCFCKSFSLGCLMEENFLNDLL